MNFSDALVRLKEGEKVARQGWNGKGMWLVLVEGSDQVPLTPGSAYHEALGGPGPININPHIDMMTATGEMQPGWLASQTDMLAEDWEVVH